MVTMALDLNNRKPGWVGAPFCGAASMIILLCQSLERYFHVRPLYSSPCIRAIILFHFVYLNLTCQHFFRCEILRNLGSCLWTSRRCGLSGASPPVLPRWLNLWLAGGGGLNDGLTHHISLFSISFHLLQNANHFNCYTLNLLFA